MATKAATKKPAKAKTKPATSARRTTKPTAAATPAAKAKVAAGAGTAASPWQLATPPGSSAFVAWRDEAATPPALVCKVGATVLSYDLRCIADLKAMLVQHGGWVALGGTDEQKPAPDGTVEAWGRSPTNPVGGWYGLKKGLRGRFGVYVPPVLEVLGLVDLEHQPRNNRMRAR